MTQPAITTDTEIMNGTPCFRGTRVPFKNLTDYLKGGHPLEVFLRQFPTVTREMANQSLEEANQSIWGTADRPASPRSAQHCVNEIRYRVAK